MRPKVTDDVGLTELDEVNEELSTLLLLVSVPSNMAVGSHDLVTELGGPVCSAFAATATVSQDFIRGVIKFSPSCPVSVVSKAIDLVQAH